MRQDAQLNIGCGYRDTIDLEHILEKISPEQHLAIE